MSVFRHRANASRKFSGACRSGVRPSSGAALFSSPLRLPATKKFSCSHAGPVGLRISDFLRHSDLVIRHSIPPLPMNQKGASLRAPVLGRSIVL